VSQAYQLVAQKIRPSVVSVSAIKSVSNPSGLGSGVIMSEDGYIMTNAHVLDGASQFYVELHDRRRYKATLIGEDSISDLALLKIEAPNLISADWGDSDASDVGSIVWAIGSPYGFQQTVTSGILSGKDRPGDANHSKQNLLQTDAAVNPGNSGGPLVDSLGRVIGINTSIFGETFQGISFAVPSATAMFVYQKLKDEGTVTRGYLGVYPTAVDSRDARRMQLADLNGAKLLQVLSQSPAYRAGIRENDIIRSWNGIEIKEYKTLFRLAEMTEPYTTVDITLLRNGEQLRTQVTLDKLQEPRKERVSQIYTTE
jgi:serine protease Do